MKAHILTRGMERVVGHIDSGAEQVQEGDVVHTRSGQYVVATIRRSHVVQHDNRLATVLHLLVDPK